MALQGSEIELLVKKIREKYSEYSSKHSRKWFNPESFEERLAMAVKNRMNLEPFILAEISNFEKLREKYDEKKKKGSFSEKVDKIIEENFARIKKYKSIEFHPSACIEITHLYGAMSELGGNYLAAVWPLIKSSAQKDKFRIIENSFQFMADHHSTSLPKRIQDHSMLLSRKGVTELDVEKDKNDYLKESAFILHDLVSLCDEIVSTRDPDLEQPLRFDKYFMEEKKRKEVSKLFSGLTGYGAILKVREIAYSIIQDFRLSAFKKST